MLNVVPVDCVVDISTVCVDNDIATLYTFSLLQLAFASDSLCYGCQLCVWPVLMESMFHFTVRLCSSNRLPCKLQGVPARFRLHCMGPQLVCYRYHLVFLIFGYITLGALPAKLQND